MGCSAVPHLLSSPPLSSSQICSAVPQSCPAVLQTAQQSPKLICSLKRCPAVPQTDLTPPSCPAVPPNCPAVPQAALQSPKLQRSPPCCPAVPTAFQADLHFSATALSLIHFICDTPNSSDVSKGCYNTECRAGAAALYSVLHRPPSQWQSAATGRCSMVWYGRPGLVPDLRYSSRYPLAVLAAS